MMGLSNRTTSNLPWVEKYRPKTFEQIYLNEYLKKRLLTYDSSNITHMIISGNPGIGKTTSAILLIKRILIDEDSYIELNASDNRGINMILNLVNTFCKKKTDDIIKIILLDEADNLTNKAQQQLITFMDLYPNTKFIFTCNNHSYLIEELQSRMTHFKFTIPSNENIIQYLQYILKSEGITTFPTETLNDIILISNRDFRICTNYLEAITSISSFSNFYDVFKVKYLIHMKELVQLLFDSNMRSIEKIIEKYIIILDYGVPNNDILISIIYIIDNYNLYYTDVDNNTSHTIDQNLKVESINLIYMYYFKIIETFDSKLYMIELFYNMKNKLLSV